MRILLVLNGSLSFSDIKAAVISITMRSTITFLFSYKSVRTKTMLLERNAPCLSLSNAFKLYTMAVTISTVYTIELVEQLGDKVHIRLRFIFCDFTIPLYSKFGFFLHVI